MAGSILQPQDLCLMPFLPRSEETRQMLSNSDYISLRASCAVVTAGGQGPLWPSHSGFAVCDATCLLWRGSSGCWGGHGSAAHMFVKMNPLS